jgi:hypothetical protein
VVVIDNEQLKLQFYLLNGFMLKLMGSGMMEVAIADVSSSFLLRHWNVRMTRLEIQPIMIRLDGLF